MNKIYGEETFYTSRDLQTLIEYFDTHSLSSLKEICMKIQFSPRQFKDILHQIATAPILEKEPGPYSFPSSSSFRTGNIRVSLPSGQISIDITESAQKFHAEIYNLIFCVEFDDLPLEFKEEALYNDIIKWRFKIRK